MPLSESVLLPGNFTAVQLLVDILFLKLTRKIYDLLILKFEVLNH